MKKVFSSMGVFLLILVLAACSSGESSSSTPAPPNNNDSKAKETSNSGGGSGSPINLTWAAGPSGGGWHSMATGISALVKEQHQY